jgi:DNA-binding response OmpR family regulator
MSAFENKKILIIDDDEDINMTLSDLLESEGFETVRAKNGKVALDYLNSFSDPDLPDLVLLDYSMPVMNGKEFCRAKAGVGRLSSIPVVMITAGGNLMDVMEACDTEGYMAKPMDMVSVLKMVKHFVDYKHDNNFI